MNKKTLLLLIGLAAFAALLLYAKTRPPQQISLNSDTQSVGEIMTEAQKFAAAVASGEPYYCEISGNDTTLTYHLKEGKMHMTTVTPDYEGYAINDTVTLYSWNSQSKQGTKMTLPTKEELESQAKNLPSPSDAPSFGTASDYDNYQSQGYTINCQQQAIDNSLFLPPSDITFIDPTATMKDVMPDGQNLDLNKLQEMAKDYEGLVPTEN